MSEQRFESVWDALEQTGFEAANMKARAQLMIAIRSAVESWNITQREAAARLGLTQPRLNQLLRGHVDRFSLDALIAVADKAGLVVTIDVDERAA